VLPEIRESQKRLFRCCRESGKARKGFSGAAGNPGRLKKAFPVLPGIREGPKRLFRCCRESGRAKKGFSSAAGNPGELKKPFLALPQPWLSQMRTF
jgi:hypothetical protein